MASLAIDKGSTLAPFRQIYESRRHIGLLSDSTFATPDRGAEINPADVFEPSVPQIIPLPNRAQFEAAVARWRNDIIFDSLPDEMKEHESFQVIIQEGGRVVPLIAASLRRSPSFLFLALEEIFGEDPVPQEAYGNLQSTVSSWLRWLQR